MSAQKARNIVAVESYRRPDGAARCKVTLEGGEIVALHSLSRVEVLKAAKLAFPGYSGKAWWPLKVDEIREAIRTETVPQAVKDYGNEPEPQEPAAAPETPEPAPEPATVPTGITPEQQRLLDALAALTGGQQAPAGVDEAAVRRIVDNALIEAQDRLPVVRIEVKGASGAVKALPEVRHETLPKVVRYLGAGVNVFLVGPAGSGKSTIAEQAADALGDRFGAISLGPTTPTSKLFGYNDATGHYVSTPFREVYENGGIFLFDELDNGHPGLVAEINQATSNGYCAFADQVVKRHPDCRLVATGNTYGRGPDRLFVGRNILDAATLDRFTIVEVPVDERLESAVALGHAGNDATLRDVIEAHVKLVQKTRQRVLDAKLPLVVSPRASIDGAKLLSAGATPEEVREDRLCAGWSHEHRSKAGLPTT